tara:strand:- start:196 stop:1473 length:1278 start_codon:yes stop_codon:yes gene_type:complete
MIIDEKILDLITTETKEIFMESWDTNSRTFESFLHRNKNKPFHWLGIIKVLEQLKKIDNANQIYKYLLKDPEIKKAAIAESYAKFSSIYLDISQTKLAYKHAIELSNRKEISIYYAKYLTSKNEYDEAERIYLGAREKFNSSVNDFDLAEIYIQTGKINLAIDVYKDVIKRTPSKGEAWRLLRYAEQLLVQQQNSIADNQIIKSISFKREHQKSGITILQNFGDLLNDKYPEGGVAFTIKQEGLKIIMVIDHPEGEKETVEDYLNRYGLVVTGKISPEEFSADPIMVLDLKRQLIQLESDLKWSNEKQLLLTNTINGQDRHIESLSNQLEYFQSQLTEVLSNKHIEMRSLLELLNRADNQAESLIQPLISSINNENIQDTQNALECIKNSDNSLFQKLNDLVLNTMASAGANAPAWIDYLSKVLP